MQISKKGKILIIAVFVLIIAGTVLLNTALFHINPIKLGYHRFDYGSYVIYSRSDSVDKDYENLYAIIARNELTHKLTYNSKIRVIICESQSEINRFQPLVSRLDRKNAGAFAPWPNAIYITPKIKEKYNSPHGAFAHESSHILLFQNYGIIRSTILWQRYEWIPEGFATYLSQWPNYFPKESLFDKIHNAGIDMSNGELLGNKVKSEVMLPIRYMIYNYFIEYLIQQNDENSAINFMKKSCENPKETNRIFKDTFMRSFSECVKNFYLDLAHDGT